MVTLGIESTAHTASVGIVDDAAKVLALAGDMYRPPAGGIHPREAANHHVDLLPGLVTKALADARIDPHEIDAVAFAQGPGLGPCLRAGATVARLLARQIGWIHADLDKRIVARVGLSVPAIFAQLGEPAFRQTEREELERILGEAAATAKPTIVSLGGGTMAQPANMELLKQAGCAIVWLQCSVEELIQRCSHITDRPLFKDEASFRQLYQDRLPFYQLAHHRVEGSIEPLRVVQSIIALGILEGVPL